MHILITLPVLILVACAYAGAVTLDTNEILNMHNDFRRRVKASNMKKMSWDPTLVQSAQTTANKCVFAHTDQATRTAGRFGENLWAMGEPFSGSVGQRGASDWFAENNSGQCGKQFSPACGHYTQMVWADSSRLGCAYAYCPQGLVNQPAMKHFLVCHYSPSGNTMGRDAYQYDNGRTCTTCSGNCDNGLCVDGAGGGSSGSSGYGVQQQAGYGGQQQAGYSVQQQAGYGGQQQAGYGGQQQARYGQQQVGFGGGYGGFGGGGSYGGQQPAMRRRAK